VSSGHSHEVGSGHSDGHTHAGGLRQFASGLVSPHSHDAADGIDGALAGSAEGIRAVKLSLFGLILTAGLQLVVVAASGSVALLADTVHNFGDAVTAIPLWLAFALGRRAASRHYTYGYGRAEDFAGTQRHGSRLTADSPLLTAIASQRRYSTP